MGTRRWRPGRAVARTVGVSVTAGCVGLFGLLAPVVANAAAGGDDNKGDVWVDNVGQPPGPGHEMDPHLQCQDINLWGDALADGNGTYTIDGWPPSGSQEQVYADTWTYNQSTGGDQVTSVIDVHTLVANAAKAGDAPTNGQGYHFKLEFSQDPQKHKTFWVNCPAPTPPPPPPPTGFLEICKKAASSAVTGDFQFTVEGKTYTVPVGACSSAIQVTPGNVTVTEVKRSGFALAGVTTVPSSRLVSTNLSGQSAVVSVPAGDISTETVVNFTNKAVPPPTGYLEICKKAASSAVTGNFQFTVQGKTYTVPVGACSSAIQVNAGNVTVTEIKRNGFALAGVTTVPSSRLVSTNLSGQSAVVKVPAGNVSTETIVNFTNKAVPPSTGRLKVCQVAGSGVATGTNVTFSVGGSTVTVPAGPAPGGYCQLVSGTFVTGTNVTVTQHIPSGDTVSSITVAPSGRLVSKNLSQGTATVRVGTGTTEVTFTDQG